MQACQNVDIMFLLGIASGAVIMYSLYMTMYHFSCGSVFANPFWKWISEIEMSHRIMQVILVNVPILSKILYHSSIMMDTILSQWFLEGGKTNSYQRYCWRNKWNSSKAWNYQRLCQLIHTDFKVFKESKWTSTFFIVMTILNMCWVDGLQCWWFQMSRICEIRSTLFQEVLTFCCATLIFCSASRLS